MSKIVIYFNENGIKKTIIKVLTKLNQFFNLKYIIYHADLDSISVNAHGSLTGVKIVNYNMLCEELLNNEVIHSKRKSTIIEWSHRFELGATLHLIYNEETLSGYMWTVKKKLYSGFFFPTSNRDIHFFDQLIFPIFRGKNLNAIATNIILYESKCDGFKNAYLCIGVWNKSNIKSISKTYFLPIGRARRFFWGKKVIIVWDKDSYS